LLSVVSTAFDASVEVLFTVWPFLSMTWVMWWRWLRLPMKPTCWLSASIGAGLGFVMIGLGSVEQMEGSPPWCLYLAAYLFNESGRLRPAVILFSVAAGQCHRISRLCLGLYPRKSR